MNERKSYILSHILRMKNILYFHQKLSISPVMSKIPFSYILTITDFGRYHFCPIWQIFQKYYYVLYYVIIIYVLLFTIRFGQRLLQDISGLKLNSLSFNLPTSDTKNTLRLLPQDQLQVLGSLLDDGTACVLCLTAANGNSKILLFSLNEFISCFYILQI